MDYTSAHEIRVIVEQAAEQKAKVAAETGGVVKAPTTEVVERWIASRIVSARDNGILMTDQQLMDFKAKRVLEVGDHARYVGEARDEAVEDHVVPRPYGQRGIIVEARQDLAQVAIVIFRPLAQSDDEELVELVVRQGTLGYLDLERTLDAAAQ